MIGLSGGKDSLLLSLALASLRKRSPVKFELRACMIDQSGGSMEAGAVLGYMAELGIPVTTITHPTYQIMKEREERSPCSLCANMRRGMLANAARAAGCGVLALGHHKDDAAETVLASAGILKNAAGVFGMLVILGICVVPFLQLGIHYLVYKLTAAVSATVSGGRVSGLIEQIGGAFGSFGWSGEAAKQITGILQECNFELPYPELKVKYIPTASDLEKCFNFGKDLAEKLKEKLQ